MPIEVTVTYIGREDTRKGVKDRRVVKKHKYDEFTRIKDMIAHAKDEVKDYTVLMGDRIIEVTATISMIVPIIQKDDSPVEVHIPIKQEYPPEEVEVECNSTHISNDK